MRGWRRHYLWLVGAVLPEDLPEADQLQPGAVFHHVLEALRDCSKNDLKTNSSICSD